MKTWFLFVDDLAVATGKKGIGTENLEKLGGILGAVSECSSGRKERIDTIHPEAEFCFCAACVSREEQVFVV